jgi:hypothetical protein
MPGILAYAPLALGVLALAGHMLSPVWGFASGGHDERGAQALAVAPGTASGQLYPGATGDVVFRVTNTTRGPVRVDTATLSRVSGTTGAGCLASHFTVNSGRVTPVVIRAEETRTVTVTGGITMDFDAPDACQGVTVTVPGKLVGSRS